MRSRSRFAAIMATVAIFAAACTSGGGATTAPAGESPAASPAGSAAGSPAAAGACANYAVSLDLWTKDSPTDGSLAFAKKLTEDFQALHPDVKFAVTQKEVGGTESLREDFLKATLAKSQPDLLFTVADHVGPFTAANAIMPLDGLIDPATYVPNALSAVQADGQTWGVPLSFGNQLMLYWNKDMVADAPADSAAMIAAAKANTGGDKVGLSFRQEESFWLVPFLGAFGGSVFAADGVTPTLDTPAMVSALKFLYDLKYTDKVTPKEADYTVADNLFKQGKAAMAINGDWALGDYSKLPFKIGVGPLPKVVGADFPKPYVAGEFIMAASGVADDPDKQCVVAEFMKYATDTAQQIEMVKALKRLPGNAAAIADAVVTGDEYLAGAAEAAKLGVPQPTNLEMRCNFDAMNGAIRAVLGKGADPQAEATKAQEAAESCISKIQ
jgi:arabinogalactan oligomer/maltooligosaccharide transport system substrate-binding protein